MNKTFIRILCLVLTAAMILGLFVGALAIIASAATEYALVTLLKEGKIKPLGRTQANLAGDGITADWSGSGFDINVSGNGGTMTVGFSSNYTAYWAVLVDDAQIWRGQTAATTGSFSVEIPAGKHTVRVVKETQMSSSESGYSNLTTLSFGGTIEKAPANKGLYIEFVGDSITCGDGGLGEYEPGVKWVGAHDSATHSYAYYVAQKLGADYSLVSRGGIGLFTGISEQEGTEQKKGMQHIYNYTSAYNPTLNGEYAFTRQPDAVVILLGANDSISSSDQYKTIEYWQGLMEDFIDQVRSKNPKAEIVLLGRDPTKTGALMNIIEARKESDPKLHLFYNGWQGNGSAALATQYAGHPNGEDAEYYADQVVNYLRYSDILSTSKDTTSYSGATYYVSENGSDSNDGKTLETAKLTLQSAIDQARTDNTFAPGSQVVIYVSGTVKNSSNNAQGIALRTITDTDGEKVPILVTTYDYKDTKAVINTGHAALNDGNGSLVFYNDVTLKNITFQSTTNTATGYRDRNLYAGYNNVVFDNVTFDMVGDTPTNNSGWRVTCGTAFGTDALPAAGQGKASITFKNGDYTNLEFATAVMSNGMWKSSTETIYDVPNADFRLVIEDGAKMSTVYNRYGNLNVGAASVTINGGTVGLYVGTGSGTSSEQKAFKGDIDLTINGGTIYGHTFATAGNYVTLEGDINTTIHGGDFFITPQSTEDSYDGYFFGGLRKCVVQDINTTITGGQFFSLFKTADVDSGYYFGVAGSGSAVNVTNKISGGAFVPMNRGAKPGHMGIFMGSFSGNITGTHRNEITGGLFDGRGVGEIGVFFGSRGVNWATGKLVNIIGKKGTQQGPLFQGTIVRLGGGWAQVGATKRTTSVLPTADDCTDTVVVSNTIYGGRFGVLHLANSSAANVDKKYYSFIKGSVETNIYGGFFQDDVYGAGNGNIYGHVTTNVYGGYFKSLYGGQQSNSLVYDGVELNIYGMDEYYPANPNDSWVICGGNKAGSVPAAHTEGRDAIKLTIRPDAANELTLNTRIKVGDTASTSSVAVYGGTFPRGFAVEGKSVGASLASGCAIFDTTTGKKATYAGTDTKVEGKVAVDKDGESFTNELTYYVSEYGQDAYSGTSMATPKKTLRAAFSEIIADNGGKSTFPVGTKITIYVEGTVNNDAGASGSQQIGGGQVLTMTDIHDHVPITITTYKFDGTNKAKIIQNHLPTNDGNGSSYVVNDLYFKDIDLQSVTNTAKGFCNNKFYAAGCAVTFDNCYISTDGKATKNDNAWYISADHFSTGGFNPLKDSFLPLYGSVTFKNGDYTNLGRAAAVGCSSIWRSAADGGSVYSIPKMFTSIIIEDGAHMGTVYNAFGTLAVGSSTVEIRGGIVDEFIGTRNGSFTDTDNVYTYNTPEIVNIVSGGTVMSFMGTGAGYYNDTSEAGQYNTINGNVTNTFSGGTVGGADFSGTNNYVKLNGNLTNNFTGAKVVIKPTDTANNGGHGIFLAGRNYSYIVGDVTNNVSAGELGVQINLASTQSGIWMGLRSGGKITGNLTNNVSGGDIWVRTAEGITADYGDFHSGNFSGGYITGTLTNNITGGTFEIPRGSYFFGQQGVSGSIGKVINIFGDVNTGNGPVFKGTQSICMAGNFGRVGVTKNSGTMPAATDSTDTVVISNKIYGGTFGGNVFASVSSGNTTNVGYVKGSVETDVYGGTFGTFYATGNAPIFGHVKTNIHGGTFNAIYGCRNGAVYDGVELNIYGMTEGSTPTGIWAGGINAPITAQTAGRDAVKLTIQPTDKLTLSMPIHIGSDGTGTATGTTTALVTGGTYTNGFAVDGLKVKDVLASGLVPLKDGDKTVVVVTEDMTTTGTDSVTLVTSKWTDTTTKLTLSETTVTYDGKNDAKVPTTTLKFHNSTLVKGTDYTVSYLRDGQATTDLNSVGTITVVATAKAPYSGTVTASYTIVRDDAVGTQIQELTDRVNAYDEATVKSSDRSDLMSLVSQINDVFTDNWSVLSESEKAALRSLLTTIDGLNEKIDDTREALTEVETGVDGYFDTTVTADDADELTALTAQIAAIPDSNLTEDEKAVKKAASDRVAALQKIITDTAKALSDAKAAVDAVDVSNLSADDVDELNALIAQINAVPDGNLTKAQKDEKKALLQRVQDMKNTIEKQAGDLDEAVAAVDAYKADQVTEQDAAELNALKNTLNAVPDNKLTAAQKEQKQAAINKVDSLLKVIADTAKALNDAKAAADAINNAAVTADDADELAALAEQITAIPDGNLTADQKAVKKAASDKVASAQKVITDTAKALNDAKAASDAIDGNKINSGDAAALDALEAQAKAIPDGNLTAAQKTEKQNILTKVETLRQILADTAEDLKELKDREEAFKTEELTSADKAKLQALAEDVENYPTDHLTEAEIQALDALKKSAEEKIAVIEKAEQIAGNIGAIEKLLEGKTTGNVTSADATDILAAQKAIEELKKDTGLSAADQAKLNGLESRANALAAQLDKAAAADDLTEEMKSITAETVQPEDKAAVEAAIEQLEKAQADYADNYTAAEKQAIAEQLELLQAALAVIEEVEEVESKAEALPATAQPDDEKAAADLKAAQDAYAALDDRQKAMVSQAALDKMEQLAKALLNYDVVKGDGSEWEQKSGKDLTFTANGPFSKFQGIQVDGSTVDAKYYTAVSGSTIITLSDDFLNGLTKGKHTITVIYTDGSTTAEFTVNPKAVSPDTGDSTNLLLLTLLAVFSVAAAAAVTVGMKKRQR